MLTGQRLLAFRERFPELPPLDTKWRARIIAEPDDEDLRMVYADWLLERGDPMGELIQIQCQQHGLPPGPARDELTAHETALLSKVVVREKRWRTLHGWIQHEVEHLGGTGCAIDRGFVSACTIDGTRLVANAARLFTVAPIRKLRVEHASQPQVVALAALLAGARVLDLTIRSDTQHAISDVAVAALAGSPNVAGLRRLDLYNARLGAAGLASLMTSTTLTALRELELEHMRIDAVVPEGVAAATIPIERLRLVWCTLAAAAVKQLATTRLDHLIELDLHCSKLGVRSAQTLAKAEFPALEVIRLANCGVRPVELEAIADSPGLPALREIDLGDVPAPAAVRRAIARKRPRRRN